jgi:hypothetical protein
MCEGSGGIAAPSLTSALNRGEWSPSHPSHFSPGERAPGMHWIEGWVGPRASLDPMEKRKNSPHCQESNPSHSEPWSIAISSELSQFLFDDVILT